MYPVGTKVARYFSDVLYSEKVIEIVGLEVWLATRWWCRMSSIDLISVVRVGGTSDDSGGAAVTSGGHARAGSQAEVAHGHAAHSQPYRTVHRQQKECLRGNIFTPARP